jgi:hypothetical protein
MAHQEDPERLINIETLNTQINAANTVLALYQEKFLHSIRFEVFIDRHGLVPDCVAVPASLSARGLSTSKLGL